MKKRREDYQTADRKSGISAEALKREEGEGKCVGLCCPLKDLDKSVRDGGVAKDELNDIVFVFFDRINLSSALRFWV